MPTPVVNRIAVHRLVIPLRTRVSHAGSQRGVADPVVVAVELSTGQIGYGETLPRPYVTGENVDSVVDAIRDVFVDALLDYHPDTFWDALETVDSLPWKDGTGQRVPAARAAVEIALLDASLKAFGRDLDDVVRWLGLPRFGRPGSLRHVRYSGVLAASDLRRTMRQLRWMYWGGLRDFKLKVGVAQDHDRLAHVGAYLRRALEGGKASLRLDANGAWSFDEAVRWFDQAPPVPVTAIEQPMPRGHDDHLPDLKERIQIPLMHDESLISLEDAHRLLNLGVADGFNIRISKCGGLIPSLRIASFASNKHIRFQLGCMVGETSILSAAGVGFIGVCPGLTWAEGCYGRFLLRADVSAKGLGFGYGGRPPKRRTSVGLGAAVDETRLVGLAEGPPALFHL